MSNPTEDANANEGDGSSIMNQQQPQPQSEAVGAAPNTNNDANNDNDDDLLITMRNYPGSTTNINASNASTANAEAPSPPQTQGLNASAIEESTLTAHHDALASTDSNISMQGGRLWQAAAHEAERRGRTMDSNGAYLPASPSQEQDMEGNGNARRSGGPTGGPGSRFAETFMERTRSRADPNALFADPKAKDTTNGTLHHVISYTLEKYLYCFLQFDITCPPMKAIVSHS
jgi:hypothetical protein